MLRPAVTSPRKTARNKPTAANLRSWRVIILRSRGEYLGSVEAPDRERAEAVAVKQFELDEGQPFKTLNATPRITAAANAISQIHTMLLSSFMI